jgi:parallel beta-helix repeat protein
VWGTLLGTSMLLLGGNVTIASAAAVRPAARAAEAHASRWSVGTNAAAATPVKTAAASPATTATNTLFVSGKGSDLNAGTSSSVSLRTVTKALSLAKSGETISILAGTYSPFVVSTAGVKITAANDAFVVGQKGVRDVVLVAASNVSISGLNVSGCVPNSDPVGGFEEGGSTTVRIGPHTTGDVLTALTVHDSESKNTQGLPFGCYGIFLQDTTDATVSGSNVYHNGYGITVEGGGTGNVIKSNTVHDNNVMIRNTSSPSNDDFGGIGIGFDDTAGVTATANTVYDNAGPSHDFVTDGGGFEIYGSSNISMTKNTIYNNLDVLETGAGGTGNCVNNVFTGNTASGRGASKLLGRSIGLILRCATNMNVSGNTISNVDWWTFWVYQRQSDGFNGGSIAGLSIQNNTITQGLDKVYDLGAMPTPVSINSNKYSFKGIFASDAAGANLNINTWRSVTGFDATDQ